MSCFVVCIRTVFQRFAARHPVCLIRAVNDCLTKSSNFRVVANNPNGVNMLEETLDCFFFRIYSTPLAVLPRHFERQKDPAMLVNYVRSAVALKLNELKFDKRAVTAIEYALIASLIAVVIIGAVTSLGKGVSGTFNSVASEL